MNYRLVRGTVIMAGLCRMCTAQDLPSCDWQNQKLLSAGTEPMHATLVACPDEATAKSIHVVSNGERVKSPWYLSLNGTWKYFYAQNPLSRVPDFYKTDFNDAAWTTIPVPSNAEVEGHARARGREAGLADVLQREHATCRSVLRPRL